MNIEDLDHNTIDTLNAMESAPNYHNWIFNEFSPYIGRSILEVGAGTGTITKKLFDFEPEFLTSIEPSEYVYQHLKSEIFEFQKQEKNKQVKFNAINSFLSNAIDKLNDKSIDTIIYINVLEHVEHDELELNLMNSCMERGGKILIFVPALQWLYGTHDKNCGHYRRYYKKELKVKVENAGFKIIKLKYFDFLGVIPWWILFKVLKVKYLKTEQSKVYDRLIIPLESILERKAAPLFGKNLILVAEKK